MKGVSVQIMGQSLVVASDAGDEWVKSVAETVDEKIKDIRAGAQTVNSVNLAILAALNFADELERLRHEHKELVDRIAAMNKRLSAAIDGEGGIVVEPSRGIREVTDFRRGREYGVSKVAGRGAYHHEAHAIFFNRNKGEGAKIYGKLRAYRPAVSRFENIKRVYRHAAYEQLIPLPPWQGLWRTKRKLYALS